MNSRRDNVEPNGEFALGLALVSPALRSVSGPQGRALLEPRMMDVLVVLARRAGELVSRDELISRCWNGAPVGDDSINRAIAGVRRAARIAGDGTFSVETVAGSGYFLMASEAVTAKHADPSRTTDLAVAQGWNAWRLGLPAADIATLDSLRGAVEATPDRADAFGLLALLLRHAVEYASAQESAALVAECEVSARRALALDGAQPEANAALNGLWPIFGDWTRRRQALLQLLAHSPRHPPSVHDMLVLEMSTGRPSAAIEHLEDLYRRDGLAAIYYYKLVYQYWTLGRLAEAERVAERGMQLWPRHPAIWFCRFWHLAFTGRAPQAALHLADASNHPPIPPGALEHFQATVAALLDPSAELREAAVAKNLAAAGRGPAQCAHALMHLSGLGELDQAFSVARGYYLQSGPVAVGSRKTPSDPTINEQHRRVTQPLFIPPCSAMRADARFLPLCEDMGLADYWRAAQVTPDFLA